ncbi:hypothetical protein Dimus_030359 [Dionaea muscipula]
MLTFGDASLTQLLGDDEEATNDKFFGQLNVELSYQQDMPNCDVSAKSSQVQECRSQNLDGLDQVIEAGTSYFMLRLACRCYLSYYYNQMYAFHRKPSTCVRSGDDRQKLIHYTLLFCTGDKFFWLFS